jgi:hypothetical protein
MDHIMNTEERIIALLPESPVKEDLAALILSRRQMGMMKYGQSVDDAQHTEREWSQHMLEEVLDASIYADRAATITDDDFFNAICTIHQRHLLCMAMDLQTRINALSTEH